MGVPVAFSPSRSGHKKSPVASTGLEVLVVLKIPIPNQKSIRRHIAGYYRAGGYYWID
jgi:hypothetical protein